MFRAVSRIFLAKQAYDWFRSRRARRRPRAY
jgi:hypothetical protein